MLKTVNWFCARVSAQVIGNPDGVRIGQKVRPVFRRLYEDGSSGLIQYGIKFEIEGSGGKSGREPGR